MSVRFSEQINELGTALALAQGDLKNPLKDATNPHFKSKYADLAGVIDAVRPIFSEHGLSVSQHPSMEGDIVTVETLVIHKSGQYMLSAVSAPVGKRDAQGVGSAITYCRRYSLAAVAGVAQDDDDGNAAVVKGDKTQTIDAKKPTTQVDDVPLGIAPWTKKDLASVLLPMKSTAELDAFIVANQTQIAADLTDEENQSFLKWFDGHRIQVAKAESLKGAKK